MTTTQGKAQIEDYDQWTINYLAGVGVEDALLERVQRLAQEVADLKGSALPTTAEHNPSAPALYRAYDDPARVAVRNILEGNGTISSLDFVDAVLALIDAAVHEAYVNAQRAVAALRWTWPADAGTDYARGRESMQEDAVRAIREAAEEARNV